MKICIIGKYPPIEGGVSTETYWLSRGLAERGHMIHIVTNAGEVDDRYRLHLGPSDWEWFEPRFSESGGYVRVYNPQSFDARDMGYIPQANPFVSKLASVAADVVRSEDCELILSYYLEPYAVAGHLAATWTNRPLIVKHAGSDLDRLFRVPDLATSYNEIIRSAQAIITQPALVPRFLAIGVSPERIVTDIRYSLPPAYFAPDGEALDFGTCALVSLDNGEQRRSTSPSHPTIGIYGKIGVAKGTFDLINALGLLRARGSDFNLAAMIGRDGFAKIREPLINAGLADITFALPFLPNWRVPSFIRACTAMCFLERDFPVAIHGPIVPREILTCGTCLIVSREIAQKQRFYREIRSGENAFIVDDPREIENLTGILQHIVSEPETARSIGKRGSSLALNQEGYSNYIVNWERCLNSVLKSRAGVPMSSPEIGDPLPSNFLEPNLVELIRAIWPSALKHRSTLLNLIGSSTEALSYCIALYEDRVQNIQATRDTVLLDALRFQIARLMLSHRTTKDGNAPFPGVDVLRTARPTRENISSLYPCRGGNYICLRFDYDITPIFAGDAALEEPRVEDAVLFLSGIERSEVEILFLRKSNSAASEFRMNSWMLKLLDACTGVALTTELIADFVRRSELRDEQLQTHLEDKIIDGLGDLYRAGIIIFRARYLEKGWRGGNRAVRISMDELRLPPALPIER